MHSALPKVLQPIAGQPLLRHVLGAARALSPAAIHVVYGHGAENVRQAFAADTDLNWVHQAEQLGTGHAVMQAIPAIPDDHRVLVLCGDVPLVRPETLERLLGEATNGELALLTAELDDPSGYGRVLRDASGEVTRIVEDKDASETERRISEINTGLIAYGAKALRAALGRLTNDNSQGEYYLTDVVGMAAEAGTKVRGSLVDEPAEVLGINDRAQLASAERAFQQRIASDLLARGVTLADPARIDVRGTLTVGRDVFIDVGAVFEGQVELGDRVHVGAYCVIKDSTLGAGTLLHPYTWMHGVRAGSGCEIGPFARLRPGAALADRVKVGNFVELKNADVADGSKVNHLTYVGDTTIGRDVNVGAGTITCNYDGANKHRTIIGDHAFIGSGVMLVAPVSIGAGATIGAGSTITKDAPDGELTLERGKQTTVAGWKRPVKKPKP